MIGKRHLAQGAAGFCCIVALESIAKLFFLALGFAAVVQLILDVLDMEGKPN